MRCLVTGATGYIGGRLVPRLLAEGHQVRCLTRSARRLRDAPWAGQVEIAVGDVSRAETLVEPFDGVDAAYYLVHSLGRADFERLDREAATNFATAARAAGAGRIIYLGGPVPPGARRSASAHLRSRAEVGDILLASGVPTAVLRAAVIIGSGSASFEMLRYLTERLPVMVTPRWVRNRIQPIAVRDVLWYLVNAVRLPTPVNRGFDIGGPEVLTYEAMMRRYAAVAGLPRRLILPVRPLSPELSALWVGLVTPVPSAIARPLVASLVHEAVAREHDIAGFLGDPPGGLTGFDQALRLALARIRDADVPTRWSGASWPGGPETSGPDIPGPATAGLGAVTVRTEDGAVVPATPAAPLPTDPDWSGGRAYVDERTHPARAPAAALWRVIEGIGGEHGWYSSRLAWGVRGLADRLIGGAGLRRGRRDPRRLAVGDALDFWRVADVVPGRTLLLRAEMRLPGQAWLRLSAEPAGPEHSRYRQRAVFVPKGLAGELYWKLLRPAHLRVFAEMARNIARVAESGAGGAGTDRLATGDRAQARPAPPGRTAAPHR